MGHPRYPDIQCITMGFTTGLAVPLFLFVASMTCDSSFGQYGPWNGPQSYAANGGSGYNNGMWYNGAGSDRQVGNSASAAAYGNGNGGMAYGGTGSAAGSSVGGYGRGAADDDGSSGSGGFSAAAADAGGMGDGTAGNGIGGFGYSAADTGDGGFVGGADGAGGFGPAPLGNIPVGLSPDPLGKVPGGYGPAPLGKALPGFGGIGIGNGFGGFGGDQGSVPAAAAGNGPVGYDGGAGGAVPSANAVGGRRNGVWKSGRGRPRKLIKPTILSGGFSLSKILPYVKNVFTNSYFKLSLPDSQKRITKCSGLFQSAGISPGSMYQAYFALYNDISATHNEMSFFEVGTLAFMEMAFGIVKFLKSTPFACMMEVAKTFDYVSLMYSLLGLMGCDDVCVAKWLTYAYSAFS